MRNQRAMCERRQLQFPPRYELAWKKFTIKSVSRILSCSRMSEMHREPEVPVEKSPSGRMFRLPCKDYLKGTFTTVKSGILQNGCSTSLRMDADSKNSALIHIARLKNSLAKGFKRKVTKVQWLC